MAKQLEKLQWADCKEVEPAEAFQYRMAPDHVRPMPGATLHHNLKSNPAQKEFAEKNGKMTTKCGKHYVWLVDGVPYTVKADTTSMRAAKAKMEERTEFSSAELRRIKARCTGMGQARRRRRVMERLLRYENHYSSGAEGYP